MTEEIVVKKKRGTGAKVAIGCGSGCLVVVLLVVVGLVGGGLYVKKLITKYENELVDYGFEKVVSAQMLEITDPVTEPTLFKAMVLTYNTDCSTNMAVLAQVCEVNGTIAGKLYFRGQVLTINAGAEVLGGIDAQAQVIQNSGTVSGGITGKYQLIETPEPSNATE
jgi:hypothetical protein